MTYSSQTQATSWTCFLLDTQGRIPYSQNPKKEVLITYFSSTRTGGYGVRDIYKAILKEGEYTEPVNLGPEINTEHTEHMPFVASDDSYLLFSSRMRPDGFGGFDIYISFRGKDGTWEKSENIGRPVNSEGDELNPNVTPDGKYLFFYRNGDIYWVAASIIERKRAK